MLLTYFPGYYGLKGHSIEQEDGEFRMCPWNHLRKTLDNNGMVLQGWPWVTRGPATEGYVPGETGSSSSTKPGKDAVSGLSGPAVCALAEAIESGAITIEGTSFLSYEEQVDIYLNLVSHRCICCS